MSETLYRWLVGGGCAAVALLCTACTATITPRRTYYPLLRLIFAGMAGIYGMNAAAQIWPQDRTPTVRLIGLGVAVVIVAVAYGFIRRRNAVPQWVASDIRKLAGHEEIDWDTLDTAMLTTLSFLRHGSASPETVAQYYEALRQWEGQQAGTARLAREAAAHKARRGEE